MLEREFRFFVDEAPGHDQVARNPLCTLGFEGLDLVLGGAVQFLARDVLVDLGRTLTVGTVGAAQVAGVRDAGGTVLGTVAAELARA